MTRAEAQSFDRLAETYDRLGELLADVVGDWLPDVMPQRGGRALDLGCGAGRHAAVLAERFDQVDAIDLSGPMIRLARRKRPRPNVAPYGRSSGQRGPTEAVEIFLLSTGDWLDHRVSDRYLSREQFELACGEVFPRAHFDRVGRAHSMIWDQRFSTSS